MQEVAQSNKAAQATTAIKAAWTALREICHPQTSVASAYGDYVGHSVLVEGIRDLDQIPGKLDVKPINSNVRRWRYSKEYDGVEFYCYAQGGEE